MAGEGYATKVSAGGTASACQASRAPVIVFGAFDRHNFGDLLFPHIAAALMPDRELIPAGLAERDLTACGGHRVAALADLAKQMSDVPVEILHVGGELLTCDAWQAAVMLTPPEEAQALIAKFADAPAAQREWVHAQLGLPDRAPYVVSRYLFPCATRIVFTAVGGVGLFESDPDLRDEVLAKLAAADAVSVRDAQTRAQLDAAGIYATLVPDPAAMVAELFGDHIDRQARRDEVAQLRSSFPRGFIAVQFSADFGDDATLNALAAQLGRVTYETGLGIALFRAGAATWHDDDAVYRRLAAHMHAGTTAQFTSLDLWDICALIAASRGYCGSSLHGRIVAMAYGLPRVNLIPPAEAGRATKQAAYAATWEADGLPHTVGVDEVAAGIFMALRSESASRQALARELEVRYRAGFAALLVRRQAVPARHLPPVG